MKLTREKRGTLSIKDHWTALLSILEVVQKQSWDLMKRKFFWLKLLYRESPQQLITRTFTELLHNDNNKEIKERLVTINKYVIIM